MVRLRSHHLGNGFILCMCMQLNTVIGEILFASRIDLGTSQLAQVLSRQKCLKCSLSGHARLDLFREGVIARLWSALILRMPVSIWESAAMRTRASATLAAARMDGRSR